MVEEGSSDEEEDKQTGHSDETDLVVVEDYVVSEGGGENIGEDAAKSESAEGERGGDFPESTSD